MGQKTGIQWTDATFNPWIGCQKISEGCRYCYAEEFAARFPRYTNAWETNRIETSAAYWAAPLAWNRQAGEEGRRMKVFCGSLCDVFEDNDQVAPIRHSLYKLWNDTKNLDWLVLTKRPENVYRMIPGIWRNPVSWPANVWLGTSVENQKMADRRIPELLDTPARIRFLSCEPLLEELNIKPYLTSSWPELSTQIHWVIVGGESGKRARSFDPFWAVDIINQCIEAAAGVAVFVKQLGSKPIGLSLRHPKGGDINEWPETLRVREFPR